MDEVGYVRVTDFGIAKVLNHQNVNETSGTPGYISPEVIEGINYTQVVDYYALGVIGYEFMTGRRPYQKKIKKGKNDNNMKHQVTIKNFDLPNGWSNEALTFINSLLIHKPESRLGYKGINELKYHPWFKNFSWDNLHQKSYKSPFIPQNKDNYDKSYCQRIDKIGLVTRQRYDKYLKNSKYESIFENFTYYNNIYITSLNKYNIKCNNNHNSNRHHSNDSSCLGSNSNNIEINVNNKDLSQNNGIKNEANLNRNNRSINLEGCCRNTINVNSVYGNTINVNSVHGHTINVNSVYGNTINVTRDQDNTINVNNSHKKIKKTKANYKYQSGFNYSMKLIESQNNTQQKTYNSSQKRNTANHQLSNNKSKSGLYENQSINSLRSKSSIPKQYPNEYYCNNKSNISSRNTLDQLMKIKMKYIYRSVSAVKQSNRDNRDTSKKKEVEKASKLPISLLKPIPTPIPNPFQTTSIAEKIRIVQRSKSNFSSISLSSQITQRKNELMNNSVNQPKRLPLSSPIDKKLCFQQSLVSTKAHTPILYESNDITDFTPHNNISSKNVHVYSIQAKNKKTLPEKKLSNAFLSKENQGISLEKYKNIKMLLMNNPKKITINRNNMSSSLVIPFSGRSNYNN